MITNIRMHNFKSWRDTGNIQLARLTGFFGTNSSGKTSLLQMPLLLKQTVESNDRNLILRTGGSGTNGIGASGVLLQLGQVTDLIYTNQNSLELGLTWSLPKPMRISTEVEGKPVSEKHEERVDLHSLTFNTTIIKAANTYVQSFEYQSQTPPFSAGMTLQKQGQVNTYALQTKVNERSPKNRRGRPAYLSKPIKCYGFPAEAVSSLQDGDYLSDVVLEFEQLFERIQYLGPLREYPKRSYSWAGDEPSSIGIKGEDAITALLARSRSAPKRKKDQTLIQKVEYWLQQMGMVHAFNVEPIGMNRTEYEVKIQRSSESAKVLITDVGFGISQVLPVLVICYYSPEGSTIILEQPEIHLHPAVQSVLADVFIDVIKTRNVQIIFESHSEHLLRRIQRRIAEEQINVGDTGMYFADIENGASTLRQLEVDELGNIRNWPPDFFGDLTGDLFAMAQSGLKRMIS